MAVECKADGAGLSLRRVCRGTIIAEATDAGRADSFVGAVRDYHLGVVTFSGRGRLRNDLSKARGRPSHTREHREPVRIPGIFYGPHDFGPMPADEDQGAPASRSGLRLDPARPLQHGPPASDRRRLGLNYDLLLPLAALPFPKIDPVLVQIGPLAIHWYGLGYIVGILFVWWYARRLAANELLWLPGQSRPKPDDLDDFLVWAAIGVVAGGRIGYVLFYDLQRYIANPQDIVAVWQGGMSFHGGFLGTTLAMILFARRRGIPVWTLFDVVAAGVPVALGLVRIANFVNSELWGKLTSVPWAFEFPNGGPFPATRRSSTKPAWRDWFCSLCCAFSPIADASSARPASSAARSSPATGWRASSSSSSASPTRRSAICSAAG